MKKIINLLLLCTMLVCLTAGCADVAEGLSLEGENRESVPVVSAHVVETAAFIEEGYYMV